MFVQILVPSTVGRVISNKIVCMWLSGSRVKGQTNINGQSDIFAIRLSSNQVSKGWEFSQSDFEGLRVQPIRFRGAGNSANQVSESWEFSQSGLEELEIQPIRFRGVRNSANQVSESWEFSQSGFEGLGVQPIRF